MIYRVLTDVVVAVHLAFVLFVVLGGIAVFWRRWVLYVHLPSFLWGAGVDIMGWVCPLTDLENSLRQQAMETTYAGGFIEHTILPILYPLGLTRTVQITLGLLVLLLNTGIYFGYWRMRRGDGPAS